MEGRKALEKLEATLEHIEHLSRDGQGSVDISYVKVALVEPWNWSSRPPGPGGPGTAP